LVVEAGHPGRARVSRADSGVPPGLSLHHLLGTDGIRKFAGRGFRRDAENHTPEACAPPELGSAANFDFGVRVECSGTRKVGSACLTETVRPEAGPTTRSWNVGRRLAASSGAYEPAGLIGRSCRRWASSRWKIGPTSTRTVSPSALIQAQYGAAGPVLLEQWLAFLVHADDRLGTDRKTGRTTPVGHTSAADTRR
jgi:hypothetical protein